MRLAEEIRHNDQPISLPSEDLYGFDPFAKAIANGIRKMPAPNGYVLAINGPWGAGKSSVINLVLHHLADETAGGPIKVIRFTPWWFRGEEALALAFFRELQAALNPSLRKKARKLLPKIGARLLRGGGLVGSVLDVAAGGGGAVASNAMAYLESLIDTDDSLEALHDELRAALGKLQDRFLIVIDDIDRLTPEESLLIFKLVKSVGQLPNVLYLLAYDRALAEKLVAERFPSEGPHFLEKIVQAVFEVPEPGANALQAQVKAQIAEVCDVSFADAPVEFFNLLYDVVTPEIAKPRDVIRFTNTIVFSWPAVAGEVHAGDFLALEVLRLFDPGLYRSIRVNKPLASAGDPPALPGRQS
jgi:predicted KAP-like P-loop ATPase